MTMLLHFTLANQSALLLFRGCACARFALLMNYLWFFVFRFCKINEEKRRKTRKKKKQLFAENDECWPRPCYFNWCCLWTQFFERSRNGCLILFRLADDEIGLCSMLISHRNDFSLEILLNVFIVDQIDWIAISRETLCMDWENKAETLSQHFYSKNWKFRKFVCDGRQNENVSHSCRNIPLTVDEPHFFQETINFINKIMQISIKRWRELFPKVFSILLSRFAVLARVTEEKPERKRRKMKKRKFISKMRRNFPLKPKTIMAKNIVKFYSIVYLESAMNPFVKHLTNPIWA